jgi:hypothetical protein
MHQGRERIEELVRRFWYEANRAVRWLVVAAAIVLALRLARRVLRVLNVLAVPVYLGAILVVAWLVFGPLLTIPRFTTEGPVVRNGVAAIVACGKKQGMREMVAAMKYAPEPRTGGWWPVKKGSCTVWYHQPPDPGQRIARHDRAQEEGLSK